MRFCASLRTTSIVVSAIALTLPFGVSTVASAEGDTKRPNLILIMADDLGTKELSCYGHPKHQTPNLDQLAQTGVQFNTCYTACICHPTRFEIMTGQYGSTNGVYHFAGRAGGPKKGAPEEEIVNHLTFGQVLKETGYATALAGKWQLTGTIPTLIHECGFDEYCMWAYKHNLPPGVEHTGGWEGAPGSRTSRYWHPSIVRNGEHVPTTIDSYGPDMFTDFVIEFASKNKDQPFFIYYPMVLTHSPAYSTPKSNPNKKEKFRNSKQEKFQENVAYMDELVGRIVKSLDKQGLRENTIVMFTGDNGTGGEGKGSPTELGARVPMIINCPGTVKPIGLTDALVDTSDVMPTLVELSGATLPVGHKLDGQSFAPILRGDMTKQREWIFSYLGDRRVLRTKRWLLEKNAPYDFGTLYDCGTGRDGTGYREVTTSTDPEVLAIKQRFTRILAGKPVPDIPKSQRGPVTRQERNRKDKSKNADKSATAFRQITDDEIIAPGAQVKKLADGFKFTEGPACDAQGNVFFTDQPNNRILKWSVDRKLSTYMQPCGRSNGLYFDDQGNLWACADEKNELWCISPEKKIQVIVKDYEGKLLNAPNDLWIRPDGGIYFSDPFYKRNYWNRGPSEQNVQAVYFLSPDRNTLIRVADDLQTPNGLIGTPDGNTLYVADIKAQRTYSYTIQPDGSLTDKRLFCEMGSDGMTIDNEGNIYVTGRGVTVFNSQGKQIAHIPIDAGWTANVCFGGEDRRTLLITAKEYLFGLQMRVQGVD